MDERIREASWTGSEGERREQGICLPPTKAPKQTPRYFIPAGTKCKVTSVSRICWRDFTTTKDLGFERFETAASGFVTFRDKGYLLQLRWKFVRCRRQV